MAKSVEAHVISSHSRRVSKHQTRKTSSAQCNVGQVIARLRVNRGLTVDEFARYIGCTASHIRGLEAGTHWPSFEMLTAVATAFNTQLTVRVLPFDA